jgi:hypothetical protein
MDAIVYGGGKNRVKDFSFAKSKATNYILISANHWAIKDSLIPDYVAFIDRPEGPHGIAIKNLIEFAAINGAKTITGNHPGQHKANIIIREPLRNNIYDSGQLATYFALTNVVGNVYLCGVDMRYGTEYHKGCLLQWGIFLRGLGDDIVRVKRL